LEDKYDESRARNEILVNKLRALEEEKEENLIRIEGRENIFLMEELEEEINQNKQRNRFSRTINPDLKESKKFTERSLILKKLKDNE
jgi:hypothetical protein